MTPTTQRTIMVGHVTAPAGLRLIPRRGAAASRRRKVGTGRSGSHGHAAPIAVQRTRGPPVRIARWDSSYPARATGSDLSRSQFVSGRSPSNIPGRKTAPYGWIDRYLRRICNRDCRPGALPLLGLGLSGLSGLSGLPGLLNRLQRREIFHQEPVSEDVTTADLA
jgi:hypothetical protein